MSYNTGNPIGSTDLRDLYDNAENLDEAVNADADSFTDRLGMSRKTWHGMEDEFDADQADRTQRWNLLLANSGYEYLADYAAGIEITEYNQVLRDTAGELWRAAPTTTLPYTTDGTGLPEGGAFVSAGDAPLRNDLNAGVGAGKGGLLVRGSVIYVDTIADLQALPTSELVDGQVVCVKEYHAGTGVGGGVFYWDANGDKALHNGGDVIDPLHTSSKTEAAWFTSQNSGPGTFNLNHQAVLTPYNFGAHENIDSSIQLNAFYANGLSSFGRAMNHEGSFNISEAIHIAGGDSFNEIKGTLKVEVTSFLENAIVLESNYQSIDGFFVIGDFHNAVEVLGGSRTSVGSVYSSGGHGYTVRYNPASSSNMLSIGKIISVNMGSVGKDVSLSYVSTSGGNTSLTRRVTLDTSLLDAETKRTLLYGVYEGILSIDGVPNIIVSYDDVGNTMTVFPGKDDGESYTGSIYKVSYGGGLLTIGSDGGQVHVGLLDSRASGISFRSASLYGGTIDRLISQSTASSIMFGRFPTSYGGIGTFINHVYQEQVLFNVIHASTNGYFSVASTAGTPIASRFLRPPLFDSSEGTGDYRLILLGYSSTRGSRYENYIPTVGKEDITGDVSVTDNGDGTYQHDILVRRADGNPHFLVIEGPSNVKILLYVWSELTSVTGRHTISVALSNLYDTGGGVLSTYSSGSDDYVRIDSGTVQISGTWTKKDQPIASW